MRYSCGELFDVETIYNELAANALRHAGRFVDVVLDTERGRGLYIVTTLAQEFTAAPRTLTRGTHARAVLCGALAGRTP